MLLEKEITRNELVYGLNSAKLCCSPYHNHPKGCPNFNKRHDCPPNVRPIDQVLNINKTMYIVGIRFDFGRHVEKMREKHPTWSEPQVRNCLYWQGSLRRKLKNKVNEIINFSELGRNWMEIYSPEAHGVNMTDTMKNIGILLEWPPEKYVWKIALLGEGL